MLWYCSLRILPQPPAWVGDVGGDKTVLRHKSEEAELGAPNPMRRSLRRISTRPHLLDESSRVLGAQSNPMRPQIIVLSNRYVITASVITLRRRSQACDVTLNPHWEIASLRLALETKHNELDPKQSDPQGSSLSAHGIVSLPFPWKTVELWRAQQKGYVVYCAGLMVDVGPEAECLSTIVTLFY